MEPVFGPDGIVISFRVHARGSRGLVPVQAKNVTHVTAYLSGMTSTYRAEIHFRGGTSIVVREPVEAFDAALRGQNNWSAWEAENRVTVDTLAAISLTAPTPAD